MKKLCFTLLITALVIQACAQKKNPQTTERDDIVYTEQDVAIFRDIIEKYGNHSDKPIGTLIPEIGKYFIGNEYVSYTLEVTNTEQLIVNLREMDCTTYAENLLALARTLKSEEQTFEHFAKELEQIRYRDGKRKAYPSRLHYFSDWIYNNRNNQLVETPADSFGVPYKNRVNFMSSHPDSYKHLKNNPEYISLIEEQEKQISNGTYYYIPKEKIGEYEHLLKEGDIIGLTTDIEGLDIAHVAILVKQNGGLHLLHASQSNQVVEISEEPISAFLKPDSKNSGIMIARPVDF